MEAASAQTPAIDALLYVATVLFILSVIAEKLTNLIRDHIKPFKYIVSGFLIVLAIALIRSDWSKVGYIYIFLIGVFVFFSVLFLLGPEWLKRKGKPLFDLGV